MLSQSWAEDLYETFFLWIGSTIRVIMGRGCTTNINDLFAGFVKIEHSFKVLTLPT